MPSASYGGAQDYSAKAASNDRGMLSNSDSLKRYLLHLPTNSEFNLTNELRRGFRRAMFWALADQGRFLEWIFPATFQQAQQQHHTDAGSSQSTFNSAVDKIEEFDWLLSEYCKASAFKQVHNHHAFHLNLPCARIFRKGEPIYRCLTCGFDDACALCPNCYLPENHDGHKVHITICQRENGGVCDCGDPEAWVKEFTCPYASPQDPNSAVMDIDTLRPIPEDFKRAYLATLEILLDYVIDVMSQSDLHFSDLLALVERVQSTTQRSTINPLRYGYTESELAIKDTSALSQMDWTSDKYNLMVYNDQIRHYQDAVQRIYLASKKVPQFAVMVTEKVQNYGRAKVISSRDIELLQERQEILSATGLATCIRLHRDIVREDMCDVILTWIYDLTESEVFKSNNDLKDLFCRAFCGRWNKGLLAANGDEHSSYQYHVGTLDPWCCIPKIPTDLGPEELPPPLHWSFTPSKWDLPDSICQECNYNLSDADYELDTTHVGSRFQYFIYLDVRFWKSIRILLHDMYSTSLITNLQYKNIISCQYVDIYPAVADMFLTMDREPEINVMCTLSTQLFTCPTNSTSIIQHGDSSRIFALIYGFLTVDEIKSPKTISLAHEISMRALKNRRWGQIFFDIGYILSRSKDTETILTGNIIPMACDILTLFQGRPVIKRESKNHIEYENPDYTAFFHAILVIYQFAEYIAGCLGHFKKNTPDSRESYSMSLQVVEYVILFLLKLENNEYPGLINESVDIRLNPDIPAHQYTVMEEIEGALVRKYDLENEKVSFLHPIHSFLSWLIELSDFKSANDIGAVIADATQSSLVASGISGAVSIFEYPIRTVVLISQIKLGFWVRNGFSVRSQLQLYRNTGLRESGYMRDLFLIQVFINTNSPNLVCYLILSRWLLMDGYVDKSNEDAVAYDLKTLPYMIEECLSFFIHVLTEDLHLRNLPNDIINETRVRNEIIHNLCFGPMNYTKLISQIPDHITADKKFDLILDDSTTYIPPKGCKDTGIYKLKEEYLEKMNPYYFNYTSNTRDDAIKFFKDRVHKRTGKPVSEIAVLPTVTDVEALGVYKYIGNFAVSVYFQRFITTTLKHILEEGVEKLDTMLETVLHLVHICSYESTINVAEYGFFYDVFMQRLQTDGNSIANLLYTILSNESFKDHHSKIRSIYKVFEKHGGYPLFKTLEREISHFNVWKLEEVDSLSTEESEPDRKKRLAKERQAKLMAKFKRQQSLFLAQNPSFSASSTMTDMEVDTDQDDNLNINTSDDEELDETNGWKFPEPHCLLCQNAAEDAGPFGIITNVSKSSEFRTVPFDQEYWRLKAFSDPFSLNKTASDLPEYTQAWHEYMRGVKDANVVGPGFTLHQNIDSKLVSTSCGHGMHFQCYLNYLNTSHSKLGQITRQTPENIDHKEFLCPLCKSLNNMFIPILWSSNRKSLRTFLQPASNTEQQFASLLSEIVSNDQWMRHFAEVADSDIARSTTLTPSACEMIEQYLSETSGNAPSTASSSPATSFDGGDHFLRLLLSNMFQTLSLLTFPHIYKADSTAILANTIKSTEISLRGVQSPGALLIEQLSNHQLVNLRTMHEFRNTTLQLRAKLSKELNPRVELYLKLIANLFILSGEQFNRSILERDFFEVLVNTFPLPSLGFCFNSILKVCFLGTIIQSLYVISTEVIDCGIFNRGNEYSIFDIPKLDSVGDEAATICTTIFKEIVGSRILDGNAIDDTLGGHSEIELGKVLFSMVLKSITPFLRRSAIFAYVACAKTEGVDLLRDFTAINDRKTLEADDLCKFLNIEGLSSIVVKLGVLNTAENSALEDFFKFANSKQDESGRGAGLTKRLEYPGLIKLIDLPDRLDHFFTNYYYLDIHDNPHRCIENPAICLFCGQVVDIQKTAIGCKEGQCTTHFLKECANTVGIFLLPKERCVLLMYNNGGSFYSAPFLDQHGELASEAKRGKTLHLTTSRYDDLIRNIWLQHDIPNYVARKLDSVIDAGGWDTL